MKFNRIASLLLATVLASGVSAAPAFALEYDFSTQAPGQQFYHATTVGSDAAADSGTIVVGADGTIGTDESNLPNSSPLSVLDLPVGEYPDAWGKSTDIAIAQNTIFPNAYAPSTQWSGILGWAGYDNIKVSSGALPTGAEMALNAAGAYHATAVKPMPTISTNGAIGQLQIPAINLNRYIYEGTSQTNMGKGIAHFDCTPGWDGNVAFAGHNRNDSNTAAFQRLKDVTYGDIIYYTTAFGTRTYQVVSIETCATTDTSGLLQDGTNKLTMYTCQMNQPALKLKVVAALNG